MKRIRFYIAIGLLLWHSAALFSQKDTTTNPKIPEAKSFISAHKIPIDGTNISYKAIAEETYLTNKQGDSVASIWSVSYLRVNDDQDLNRPVTFIFNGGPGSASVWLHMGMFGPKLVKVPTNADKDDGAAPFNLVPNTKSLLDITDMVFIDPVGTGYSRVIGKGKVEDYWGLMEDAHSIAQFMRTWVTKHNRWMSPKYIAGESFGTTRAAAVANVLERDGQDMALNGLILISQALDYAGSTSIHDNITSYITYLPSMAATAWYHKKAGNGKDLETFVEEARQYAYNNYAGILYKGDLISDSEKASAAEQLSYFTGLKKDYILQSNLRVLIPRFQMKLLEDEGLSLGRLDGRFMGNERDKTADRPHLGDPASYQIESAYTASLNHYLANDLNVKMTRPYLTGNDDIGNKWNWRDAPDGQYWEPMPVNTARLLGETMRRNDDLNVLVVSGYYDLICPFFDAEITFNRNGILSNQVQFKYYEAGHMMYTHEEDFIKLSNDIRQFLIEDNR